jgi:hypothetical protein
VVVKTAPVSIGGGIVKGVEVATGTLTLGHKVRGEKTYSVMKGAAVLLDGKDGIRKPADLPVGSVASLKLLIDRRRYGKSGSSNTVDGIATRKLRQEE